MPARKLMTPAERWMAMSAAIVDIGLCRAGGPFTMGPASISSATAPVQPRPIGVM